MPLDAYPVVDGGLLATLAARLHADPFNAVATGIFVLAILHTFVAARFTHWPTTCSTGTTSADGARAWGRSRACRPSCCTFSGEVEVVFGLWAIVLHGGDDGAPGVGHRAALLQRHGQLHRAAVRGRDHGAGVDAARSSALPRPRCAAWPASAAARRRRGGLTILTIGPLLGSFITEPAAMTICALLLARQFYDLQPAHAAQVRDARPAVRQRVDRRHAHALRRAARS